MTSVFQPFIFSGVWVFCFGVVFLGGGGFAGFVVSVLGMFFLLVEFDDNEVSFLCVCFQVRRHYHQTIVVEWSLDSGDQ